MNKSGINKNGYPEGKPEHSPSIHRQVAHKEIYLKNRDKYSKSFREYQVHHIDGEKLNGSVKNLYICTKEQHNLIHQEQKARLKRFANSQEIDIFLNKRNNEQLTNFNENKSYNPKTILTKEDINEQEIKIKEEEEIKEKIKQEIRKNVIKQQPNIKIKKYPKLTKKELIKLKKENDKRIEELIAERIEEEEKENKRNVIKQQPNIKIEYHPLTKEDKRKQEREWIERINKEEANPIKREEVITNKRKEIIKESKRKEQETNKINEEEKSYLWVLFIIISLIIGVIILSPYLHPNKSNDTINNPIEQIPSYEVKTSSTEVIIKNNQDKPISLSVTYRMYSNWFGIDSQQTKVFDVPSNSEQTFDVWNNQGCSTAPCSVIIESFEEI